LEKVLKHYDIATIAKLVIRRLTDAKWVRKMEYKINARIAQLVEHDLAKVGVAGSSPVSRSKNNNKKVRFLLKI
jgi:hypothetical protein